MSFKLGLKVTIHNRSFLYEYLPSGRLEQEDDNELLLENGEYILWEGYSIGDNESLFTEDAFQLLQEDDGLILLDGLALWNRITQEDGFNVLLENGDYLAFDGTVPINTHLTTETDFNIVQETGYRLRVETGSIDEVK